MPAGKCMTYPPVTCDKEKSQLFFALFRNHKLTLTVIALAFV